ncbi:MULTISPECIES: phosphoglucomutase/phosphomannomutase PgmG [unclassified Sphingomonas]|uniref:phosphoglucomutase/phosphomannomutase PgmG n=1 Tax=unclassified Sphingomonas TaxID=196159 RepID=UPI0006FB05BC|nr:MULTISPECIES: phosphomannomutase/phosphoglucomutase [unclassified Sphingomonas]KQM92591.1 phosphomannomutase [Sphingomonas sp. Leaf226]MDY0967792.1 phosphomannomutase/phosphoglucomutase [Sphingomonas sp. CFBP9021]
MTHRFDPSALREYDVRGIVGKSLGPADATAIGRGFATRVRGIGGTRVAVGYDGRLSSPALEAALVAGLIAGGVDVVRIGLGPSPMLYYAEATLEVDGGIHVTGSHNPAEYNGFKMVLRHAPFFGDDIQDLAALAASGAWSEGAGVVTTVDLRDAYVGRLMAGYAGGAYRIGWDTGNGAAGPVIEALVKLLPGEHHVIFAEVDGNFPNHHPDPTEESNLADLKRLVTKNNLDFGLAFDGDGDRIGAVDALGRVIWGDQILSILVEPALREHPGASIVADVKSSQALFDRITALGGKAVMAPTGHSLMKTAMTRTGAPLGGELSGHLFFAGDYYGFDDAAYAAIRLIRAVHLSGQSLTALHDAMPALVATPDLRFPVDDAEKFAVVDAVVARLARDGAVVDLTDGARVTTPEGWWLLRASNTQAMLTVRAEARTDDALASLLAAVDAHLAACGVARA